MNRPVRVEAWRVHDTGLVAAPGPFRRLPGAVRHHQGQGAAWPARVVLATVDDSLVVSTSGGDAVGRWPLTAVTLRVVSAGPPISFVVELPGAAHLLSAAADGATDDLLATLA